MKKWRKTFIGAFATAMLVFAGTAPASAAYYTGLDIDACNTTLTNGTTFGRTSVIAGPCSQMVVGIKVQYPGTAAYWTNYVVGVGSTNTLLTSYRSSTNCYVIRSTHSILDGLGIYAFNV